MILKPLSPKEEIPQALATTVSNAALMSVYNSTAGAIQVRIDNGELPVNQPTIVIGAGERVIIEKAFTDDIYVEDISGGALGNPTGVFATKIAYAN